MCIVVPQCSALMWPNIFFYIQVQLLSQCLIGAVIVYCHASKRLCCVTDHHSSSSHSSLLRSLAILRIREWLFCISFKSLYKKIHQNELLNLAEQITTCVLNLQHHCFQWWYVSDYIFLQIMLPDSSLQLPLRVLRMLLHSVVLLLGTWVGLPSGE